MNDSQDHELGSNRIHAVACATGESVHDGPCAAPQDDPRVVQALREYVTALEAGRRPNRQEFLARYAEIADSLAECLAGLELVYEAAPQLQQPARAASNAPGEYQPLAPLGDFDIVREIGRGGMGIVYEAVQLSLGRRVALKVLPFAAAMDPKQRQRFKNEAQAAAHLHHTNIVPVYAVGCERGVHFYAMQFIEGQTVSALILELRRLAGLEATDSTGSAASMSALASELISGRWAPVKIKGGAVVGWCGGEEPSVPYRATTSPPHHPTTAPPRDPTLPVAARSTERSGNNPALFRTVARFGVQAAEALEHAHGKGIIHRDIKPANLLVDLEGNLWVTDFGLARMLSEAGLTMTGDLVGTLRYMSPEQALAKRVPLDHRTDIYSLGVTLYELLTLRPALDGRDRQEVMQQIAFEEPLSPRRWNKAIPVELETILRKAMDKNPAERYATAQELADDLRRFLDDKPLRAKKPTLLDRTRKWARRHQAVVTTGMAGLIVAVGILTVSTLLILSAYRSEAEEKKNALKDRQQAVTALYRSYVREAEALRRARGDGYRRTAWHLLHQALQLDTPEKDVNQLRQEAIASMGDFVGMDPTVWSHFPADVNTIALHPNGRLLAIGLNDGMVLLRDLASDNSPAQPTRHASPVTGLAFTPDGNRLVSADRKGTMHLCEAKANGDWVLARTIKAEPKLAALFPSSPFPFFVPYLVFPTLSSLAIAPDNRELAASLLFTPGGFRSPFFFPEESGLLPSTIARWNLASGSGRSHLETGRGLEWTRCPVFSPDGKSLAACYLRYMGDHASLQAQHGVLLWNLQNRQEPADLSLDLGFVHHVHFSPDGKLLACACEEGLALFDTRTFRSQLFPRAGRASSVAFSPDSHLLAIANCQLGQVRLWDAAGNRELAVLGHPLSGTADAIHSLACSRDTLVSASLRAVRKWNLAGSGEKLILAGHNKGISNLTFSPDGQRLVSAGKDKVVRIWDPTTGQLLQQLPRFGAEVEAVAFSGHRQMLATGDWAGSLQIWGVPSGAPLATLTDHGLGRRIWAAAFSPNGRYFAACGQGSCAGGERGIALWRLQPGGTKAGMGESLRLEPILGPAASPVYSIAFSPDSQLLAWADGYNCVHLWDLECCRERPFARVRLAGNIRCLAFEPGGKHLLFVSDIGVAEAWDVTSGRRAYTFAGHESHPRDEIDRLDNRIALNSDGSRLAGVCGRNLTVWEKGSRSPLLRLPQEQGIIYSFGWSPTRDLLAIGTGDGELVIWDLAKIKAQLDEIGLGW